MNVIKYIDCWGNKDYEAFGDIYYLEDITNPLDVKNELIKLLLKVEYDEDTEYYNERYHLFGPFKMSKILVVVPEWYHNTITIPNNAEIYTLEGNEGCRFTDDMALGILVFDKEKHKGMFYTIWDEPCVIKNVLENIDDIHEVFDDEFADLVENKLNSDEFDVIIVTM